MALAGLILAGGAGKRWGGPKAWAALPDGRSFLEACVAALREAGSSPIVATLPCGSSDPQIPALNVVALPHQGLDMLGSIRVGLVRILEVARWSSLAILPVDHPLVCSDTVTALAATPSSAAVPTFNTKRGHPVCLSRTVAEAIVSRSLPGSSLREILRSVTAVDVPVGDPAVIANCNTPDALAMALRALHSRAEAVPGTPTCPETQNSKLKTQN
jgi:CTP:molybdopterin cytidylyltransferase MocA